MSSIFSEKAFYKECISFLSKDKIISGGTKLEETFSNFFSNIVKNNFQVQSELSYYRNCLREPRSHSKFNKKV